MTPASPTEGRPVEPCDLLVHGGRLFDLAHGVLAGDAIAVVGGRVAEVGAAHELLGRWAPRRRLDARGHLVVPGFVDAHVHVGAHLGAARPYAPATGPGQFAGASDSRGVARMVAEFCAMEVPAEVVVPIARAVFTAMVRSGFTGVVDAGGPGADGVAQAAEEVGIRAAVGPSLADQWHDDDGTFGRHADADALLAGAEAFIARHDGRGEGRVRAIVSGVETSACSDALLAGIAALAADRGVPTHVHSHITTDAEREHRALHGRGQADRLAEVGMLTERCTVMHAGALTAGDVAAFRSTGVTVNHNPVGNAMHAFGTVGLGAVPRLVEAGVPIVLGSDHAPAVPTPFDLVRAALMLHRDAAAREDALTLEDALAMGWNAGASLGTASPHGRLEAGHAADLVVVDTTGAHHLASAHPVPGLALHARAADVRAVVVDGRVLVEDGRLAGADEEAIVAAARSTIAALGGR